MNRAALVGLRNARWDEGTGGRRGEGRTWTRCAQSDNSHPSRLRVRRTAGCKLYPAWSDQCVSRVNGMKEELHNREGLHTIELSNATTGNCQIEVVVAQIPSSVSRLHNQLLTADRSARER